jgi:hypothetical protein
MEYKARCHCSLCIRRGAVLSWTYIPAVNFARHQELPVIEDPG